MKCAKCNEKADGAIIVHGGQAYNFCSTCTKIIESFPHTGAEIFDLFMRPSSEWTKADRNIFEARKNRAQNKLAWVDK